MINKKYVEDYVYQELNKHEENNSKWGKWFALFAFINEVFLLWLIWLVWSSK